MKNISELAKTELIKLSDGNEEYARFNRRIVNTQKQVLGVRLPDLRRLARKLAKELRSDGIANYLKSLDRNIYEQVLLAGLLINYANISDREAIDLAKKYLNLADSWAEIDAFASKRKNFDEKLWWDFAVQNLGSSQEFVVRYGIIEMMANFLNENYIKDVFAHLRQVEHDGYYVRMGMAWLYATAAVKFYDQTLHEIKTAKLSSWTKRKALTKMLESYQFTLDLYDVLQESVYDDSTNTWMHSCGSTLAESTVRHPVHLKSMPLTGFGEAVTEDVPYCPSCQKKPAQDGSVLYHEDMEAHEQRLLNKIRNRSRE